MVYSPARLSPPDSTNSNSGSNVACSSSSAPRFAEMSSRIAACGHPPVSMARIRSAGRAPFRMRNSWSSRVKMSFVTAAVPVCCCQRAVQLFQSSRLTDIVFLPHCPTEIQQQSSLSRPDGPAAPDQPDCSSSRSWDDVNVPSYAYCECSL